MKGLENNAYLFGLIISNALAILFLIIAIWKPRIARLLFFLLFAWACWMNWTFSVNNPDAYLQYAELSLSDTYRNFINGWFSKHIPVIIGIIATCQGLIAISMLLKGWIYKLGIIGGIIFLLAIVPLGVGSGFPCTLIAAIALFKLYNKGKQYWWFAITSPSNKTVKVHTIA
jgi:hypothetical protein